MLALDEFPADPKSKASLGSTVWGDRVGGPNDSLEPDKMDWPRHPSLPLTLQPPASRGLPPAPSNPESKELREEGFPSVGGGMARRACCWDLQGPGPGPVGEHRQRELSAADRGRGDGEGEGFLSSCSELLSGFAAAAGGWA